MIKNEYAVSEQADLLYAPLPVRPAGYLHPSRMTLGRLAATLREATRPQHAASRLGVRLRALSGRNRCLLAASGRSALRFALEHLGAGPGGEVVLSTFNCPAVVDAVLATGARPVLVDFDQDAGPAFTSVELRGRLVVLTNGLGMDEWQRYGHHIADLGGTAVLDLAQAGVAPEVLARYREAACPVVLSFGEGKPLGGLGGGAVLWSQDGASQADEVIALRAERAGVAALRRAVWAHAVMQAPAFARTASQRRVRRIPGWSHTKADHLPTESSPVKAAGPTRWEVAAAAALFDAAPAIVAASSANHDQVRGAVSAELTTCRVAPGIAELVPGIELLFPRRGMRQEFARALALRGVPSTWNYYPLHKMRPYARFASDPMPGAEHVWPRVLTVPKQPQPRITPRLLAESMICADRAVRERGAGRA